MIAFNTVPSWFTVSQATRGKSIGFKKKRFPWKKIRKISSFSLDRGYKGQSKSILNECDLERVTGGFSSAVSCQRRL